MNELCEDESKWEGIRNLFFHKVDGEYWFLEKSNTFPGQCFGLRLEKILHYEESEYQKILFFKSTNFGTVMALNGVIQCTEKDEFAYQELITHLPVMLHVAPKKILVIGGGDGGVVRELIKHVQEGVVSSITIVEIDSKVVSLLKRYLKSMSSCYDHPSVKLIIQDGVDFLASNSEKFDIIITDCSDPEGPASSFYDTLFFFSLKNSLADKNSLIIMQSSENIWLNISYLSMLLASVKKVFPNVRYSQCYLPSYTSGQLGLIIASLDQTKDLTVPTRIYPKEKESILFRYYNQFVHTNAFVLPNWSANLLNNHMT